MKKNFSCENFHHKFSLDSLLFNKSLIKTPENEKSTNNEIQEEEEKINNINNNIITAPEDNFTFRPRMKSMYIQAPPTLFLEEKEDILLTISKKQRKTSDYSEKDESLSFMSRESIIEWCRYVLSSIVLTESEKTSIFHRFCTAYDFIMEKLFLIHDTIKEQKEFKIFIITIFLITYKLEGFSIAKITISSLIEAFLSDIQIDQKELTNKIAFYEMKIIELVDFNPQIFEDNNIHQLSFLLWDLFNKKYLIALSENEKEKIEKIIKCLNEFIELSGEMIFDIFPIDKAMISFYNAVSYICSDKKDIMLALNVFYNHLSSNMKVVKIPIKEIIKYHEVFSMKIKDLNLDQK